MRSGWIWKTNGGRTKSSICDAAFGTEGSFHVDAMRDSIIANPDLAESGQRKIDWAEAHMPVLRRIREVFEAERPFAGRRVAISLHLEAKTAYLAKVIKAGGAEV